MWLPALCCEVPPSLHRWYLPPEKPNHTELLTTLRPPGLEENQRGHVKRKGQLPLACFRPQPSSQTWKGATLDRDAGVLRRPQPLLLFVSNGMSSADKACSPGHRAMRKHRKWLLEATKLGWTFPGGRCQEPLPCGGPSQLLALPHRLPALPSTLASGLSPGPGSGFLLVSLMSSIFRLNEIGQYLHKIRCDHPITLKKIQLSRITKNKPDEVGGSSGGS